jgi:hypothetical protein
VEAIAGSGDRQPRQCSSEVAGRVSLDHAWSGSAAVDAVVTALVLAASRPSVNVRACGCCSWLTLVARSGPVRPGRSLLGRGQRAHNPRCAMFADVGETCAAVPRQERDVPPSDLAAGRRQIAGAPRRSSSHRRAGSLQLLTKQRRSRKPDRPAHSPGCGTVSVRARFMQTRRKSRFGAGRSSARFARVIGRAASPALARSTRPAALAAARRLQNAHHRALPPRRLGSCAPATRRARSARACRAGHTTRTRGR